MPIEPGDVLTVPTGAGLPPALFIAAEVMGLGTARSGTAGPFGPDELDALDVLPTTPVPALAVWGLVVVAGLFLGLAVWMTARPPLPGTAARGA